MLGLFFFFLTGEPGQTVNKGHSTGSTLAKGAGLRKPVREGYETRKRSSGVTHDHVRPGMYPCVLLFSKENYYMSR